MRKDLHVVENSGPTPGEHTREAADNEAAFLVRLGETLDDLLRLACRLERDPDRGRDLLQESLVTAYRRRSQLARLESFRAWAAQIVRRTYLNSRRGRRELSWSESDHESIEPAFAPRPLDPEERFLARERAAEIRAALDALPLGQREAVLLIDGLGFSFAEASTALGAPPGTVASRVARGRSAIRCQLRHLVQEGRNR